MIQDFAVAYRDWIAADGSMKPPVVVMLNGGITWAVDADGLLMTTILPTVDGDWCMLSVLFPMSLGAAQSKHRQRRFPVATGDPIKIQRKHDEVTGGSGEHYARFIVEVMTAPAADQ